MSTMQIQSTVIFIALTHLLSVTAAPLSVPTESASCATLAVRSHSEYGDLVIDRSPSDHPISFGDCDDDGLLPDPEAGSSSNRFSESSGVGRGFATPEEKHADLTGDNVKAGSKGSKIVSETTWNYRLSDPARSQIDAPADLGKDANPNADGNTSLGDNLKAGSSRNKFYESTGGRRSATSPKAFSEESKTLAGDESNQTETEMEDDDDISKSGRDRNMFQEWAGGRRARSRRTDYGKDENPNADGNRQGAGTGGVTGGDEKETTGSKAWKSSTETVMFKVKEARDVVEERGERVSRESESTTEVKRVLSTECQKEGSSRNKFIETTSY